MLWWWWLQYTLITSGLLVQWCHMQSFQSSTNLPYLRFGTPQHDACCSPQAKTWEQGFMQVLKQIWHVWTNHEGYLWAPVSHLHLYILPWNTPWVLRSFCLPCCPWNGELKKIGPWISPSYTLPHKPTVRQLNQRALETLITILNDIFSNVGGWMRFMRVIDILVRHLSDKQTATRASSNKATLFCLALTRNVIFSSQQFSLGPFFGTNNMNIYIIAFVNHES